MDLEGLYEFWFGEIREDQTYVKDRLPVWFSTHGEYDAFIRENFSGWIKHHSQLAPSIKDPHFRSNLSLVLLLDQVPRNAFRGTKKAFATDSLALELALSAIERGEAEDLHTFEKLFLYLPVQHSEDLHMQALSLDLFQELHKTSPQSLKPFTQICLTQAENHKYVIDRCGRYPHRNSVLGRISTEDEVLVLSEDKYRF